MGCAAVYIGNYTSAKVNTSKPTAHHQLKVVQNKIFASVETIFKIYPSQYSYLLPVMMHLGDSYKQNISLMCQ
jgi:hypothetical protein